MTRPNILFIMTDNQAASTLGCYGNPEAYTPRLDQLAREGVLFEQAYCPNAFCSPCRASALTGLMPSQHGVHSWLNEHNGWQKGWNALDGITTLPEILGAAGYRTALCGKYHLGDTSEPQNGFQHWVTMTDGHVRSFWKNAIIENGERYVHEGHTADFFTDKAIAYLEDQAQADEPFFMFLAYPAPYGHWPATKEPIETRHHARFADCPMDTIQRTGLNQKTVDAYNMKRSRSSKDLNFDMLLMAPNDLPTLRNFYAQISMVDENVGRLIDTLDALNLSDDTLLIFTSDHGLSVGQHGFWGHGSACYPSSMYHACHSVPLIMRRPGKVADGLRVTDHVSNHDVFATILDHAGVAQPAGGNPAISSQSLQPVLHGGSLPADRPNLVFCEQEESRVVRTPEWLYFQRFKGSENHPLGDELYDLRTDPGETVNVIDVPEHAGTLQELRDLVDRFFSQHTVPEYDLWNGGTAKDNSMRLWLWRDAWGDDWRPSY